MATIRVVMYPTYNLVSFFNTGSLTVILPSYVTSETKIVRMKKVSMVLYLYSHREVRGTAECDPVLGTKKLKFINSFCLSFRIPSW
jgi:hypothetical protein